MLVPATLGGALITVLLSVVMMAFAFIHDLGGDLLLFPATILSVSLVATTAVLSVPPSPVLMIVDFAAVLIIVGMTLVYLDRLVNVSSADALNDVHEP